MGILPRMTSVASHSRVLTLMAIGTVACSTHDSLYEHHGATGKDGSSGAGADTSTTMRDGATKSTGNSGAGGESSSVGGATAGSGGTAVIGSGGARLGSGGSGGASSAGSGGVHTPRADGGAVRTLHIVTPSVATPPGAEVHRCYHTRVPSSTDVQAVAFRSRARALNELMIYRDTDDPTPEGTLDRTGCTLGLPKWTYGAWAEDYALTMPNGVAEKLLANQPLFLDLHFVNTGGPEVTSSLSLDVDVAEGAFEQAEAIVSFNTSVRVPAKGAQTVSGNCMVPPDAKLFSVTTHTNRLSTDASVRRLLRNGQVGDEIVHTTDSANPAIAAWTAPPFVTLLPGEKLQYQCSYENDGPSTVSVGTSALSNELCMMIGYFFPAAPAGASSCN